MISLEFAAYQITRLTQLSGFPEPQPAVNDLIEALRTAARSDMHAVRTIDAFLEPDESLERGWCPTSGQIREVAWRLLSEAEQNERRPCDKCGGRGVLHLSKIVKGLEYDFAQQCPACTPSAPAEAPKKRKGKLERPAAPASWHERMEA
jgi:hypothetical protein